MDLKEIQELIRILSKSNIAEIRIEKENFKITLRTKDFYLENKTGPVMMTAPQMQMSSPVQASVAAPALATETPKAVSPAANSEAGLITIKSPMVGTFYRSGGPDKAPFVNVGDEVKTGQVICIIEAMKLFNEIESEVNGKIVKILVDNSKPIEYDQPLFLVQPS